MKRCIKGGFLVLGGVVGVVGMIIAECKIRQLSG